MTDFSAGLPVLGDELPSEFGPGGGVTSGIDFSTIDQGLTTINNTEATWSLPQIPDVVKLDLLANQSLLGEPVGDFLGGIGTEMAAPNVVSFQAPSQNVFGQAQAAGVAAAGPALGLIQPFSDLPSGFVDQTQQIYESTQQAWTNPARLQDEGALINRFRKAFQTMGNPGERNASQRAWVVPTNGAIAVKELQQQAIDAGILPEGTPVNGLWTPELRAARFQLLNQQANREMSGDRGGALSAGGAMRLLDEWTSPTGLLAAAVALDFVPDGAQIKEEYDNWGDSLKAWKDDFWDPRKAIAALGPIDDVALPIFNTVMLASGIGGVTMFATKGMLAARGGMALSTAKSAQLGLRAEQLGQAGMLGSKLSSATKGSLAYKAGQQMQAWRNYTTVQVAKRTMQEGMKLGLASQFESTVFNTGRDDDQYERYMDMRSDTPLGMAVSAVAEFGFSPQSPFMRGAVKGAAGTVKNVITYPLRELGDIGKQGEWMEGLVPHAINRLAQQGPEGLARANQIKKAAAKNPLESLVAVLDPAHDIGTPISDKTLELVGDRMRHLVFSAALDKKHTAWTGYLNIDEGGEFGARASRLLRKKFITELRDVPAPPKSLDSIENFDFNNDDHLEWLNATLDRRFNLDVDNMRAKDIIDQERLLDLDEDAFVGGGDAVQTIIRQREANRKKIMADIFDVPDSVASRAQLNDIWGDAVKHQQHRVAVANEMMMDLSKDDIVAYVERFPDVLDNGGHWDDFTAAVDMVEEWSTEIEDKVTRASLFDGVDLSWAPNPVADEMNMMMKNEIKGTLKNKMWQVFDFEIPLDETAARMGVMSKDKIDKQQATRALAMMKLLQRRQKILEQAGTTGLGQSELWEIYGQHITARQNWQRLGTDALGQMYDDLKKASPTTVMGQTKNPDVAFKFSKSSFVEYGKALKAVDAANANLPPAQRLKAVQDPLAHINRRMGEMIEDTKFWDDVGISLINRNDPVSAIKQLEKRMPYIAATVDLQDPVKAAVLKSKGYKPVMMVERLNPKDHVGLMDPLREINARRMAARSLGTFFTRTDAQALNNLKARQFRASLGERLRIVKSPKGADLTEPEIDDIENLLQQLVRTKNGRVNAADAEAGRFGEKMAKRAWSQMNPRSIRDLTPKQILEALNGNTSGAEEMSRYGAWTLKEANAIKGALLESNIVGFKYRGLADIEDRLIAKSPIMMMLEGMGGTQLESDAQGWRKVRDRILSGGSASTSDHGVQYFNHSRRVGGALVGGALAGSLAMNQDFDFDDAAKAVAGGMVGGAVANGKILSPRTIMAATAGFYGAQVAAETTQSKDIGAAAGVGSALAVMLGSPTLAKKTIAGLNGQGWAQYSRTGEGYVRMRNALRFSLSPVFDAQRYTEGLTMGQAREGEILKARLNPVKYIVNSSDYEFNSVQELTAGYQAAMKGKFGKEADIAEIMMETGSEYWMERGILGFSAVEQEAAVWAQLRRAGIEGDEAVERARRVFTYGGQARSGLEQSMNFLFFPFSFQKKFLGDVGEFFADDLSRLAVVHNSLRMHEVLDEKYDLTLLAEERLPFLNQLRDINPLAYGLSVGRLGGINAPLIQFAFENKQTRAGIDPVMNLFIPQALQIGEPSDASALGAFADQTFAVVRDYKQMHRDIIEQGHVLTSESGRTTFAETSLGWSEYQDLRTRFAESANAAGYNWSEIVRATPNDPGWGLRIDYESAVYQMRERYPAWRESYNQSIANRAERGLELRLVTNLAPEYQSSSQRKFTQFHQILQSFEQEVSELYQVSLLDDPELAPPNLQAEMRAQAARLAGADPEFHRLYREFYEADLGPITRGI